MAETPTNPTAPPQGQLLNRLLTQLAHLLHIDNGHVRVDYQHGKPKVVRPTPVYRMGGQKNV